MTDIKQGDPGGGVVAAANSASKSTANGTDQRSVKRVVLASFVGTTLEYYDFFVYGTAASIVFPVLFFPAGDATAGLLLALATYAVGYVVRPLGAALFGHFGDRIGRKNVLIATLLIMGLASALVGVLPVYGSVGLLAPIMLVILRFVQGLGIGGEWGGAALMVTESDGKGRRGLLGSLVQVAAPVGLLLATGIFSLTSALTTDEQFMAWGWRIPFLISFALVAIGFYIRMKVGESPVFAAAEEKEKEQREAEVRAPLIHVFKHYKKELALAVGARIGSDIAFYIFAMFILVYGPEHLGMDPSLALAASTLSAVAQSIAIPCFGHLCDKLGRRPVMIGGALAGIAYSFLFFAMIDSGSTFLVLIAPGIGLAVVAAMYAPIASFIPELFATNVRFTGAAVGFQMAGVFGGGFAPLIAMELIVLTQTGFSVAGYLSATLVLMVVCVALAKETSKISMTNAGK
ncbi:MFS transporter [Saccharopolyspora sp. WRP15-2]|uniref:MFS transporter n=1 Tax=Saccharopolyspora oryzae TaxID=2997343 RepID=A0ABT4UWE7_9PSEU|nr:MFS transporter [Saccharopolyspora oryzae]MDA3626032.1 MFS transporter [Saccharopolyspora oryzae]